MQRRSQRTQEPSIERKNSHPVLLENEWSNKLTQIRHIIAIDQTPINRQFRSRSQAKQILEEAMQCISNVLLSLNFNTIIQ